MLLEPGSETSLGLSDVDLSTCAWYLVYDIRLFLDEEWVFDFSEYGPESRARSKHHSDVVVQDYQCFLSTLKVSSCLFLLTAFIVSMNLY